MKKEHVNMNAVSALVLDKEIISKADARTIENMSADKKSGEGYIPSVLPTTPTTTGMKTLATHL
ncbi:hypothetical protein [Chitinophaga nivalis]|uniref:Uncharacterized protein n=1 Tax=Chitinophaga nivalis TaxID=2991709 RepID=A0ABT3IU14_9BACT|nr:hypothetical protein [Chitinophaga nivalis]MCW3462842.1 hypothetical protein [Chitinophaga nivalis]MCW3487468.1 hypothetical protein [Chitinophaga nivalis]